jgi:hypothetical protein
MCKYFCFFLVSLDAVGCVIQWKLGTRSGSYCKWVAPWKLHFSSSRKCEHELGLYEIVSWLYI